MLHFKNNVTFYNILLGNIGDWNNYLFWRLKYGQSLQIFSVTNFFFITSKTKSIHLLFEKLIPLFKKKTYLVYNQPHQI